MEKRKFGKTDMLVSVLGFGGAEIGSLAPRDQEAAKSVDRLLGSAIDAGLNVIISGARRQVGGNRLGTSAGGGRRGLHPGRFLLPETPFML